jgi:tetratricopeptide (TPR) repeat protein
LEAYNYFMRGRALYDWADFENVNQSITYFEKAVEADPNYAVAWSYLAGAGALSMIWQSIDEVGPAVIAAYERALVLDPEQSEALATKALMTQIIRRDWEAAGIFYQRAMESRDNTIAISIYAVCYLIHIDRIPQALRLYRDAEKRDPLHAGYKANLAMIHLFSGDAETAARKAREALQLNPRHEPATARLIQAYTVTGNFPAVQQLLETMPLAVRESPNTKAFIGLYHVARGDIDKARQIYQEVNDNLTPIGMLSAAILALSLGEVEESINLLERVAEEGSWVQFWSRSPFIRNNDSMRDHPRYQKLLKRMGLDEESVAKLNSRMLFD